MLFIVILKSVTASMTFNQFGIIYFYFKFLGGWVLYSPVGLKLATKLRITLKF